MRTLPTLAFYVARSYLVALLWVLLVVVALLLLFDSIELIRRAGSRPVGMGVILAMAFYHLPTLIQETLPFVFMSAAVLVFWRFSRSSELVVFRAAGLSAWQFLGPIVLTVLFLSTLNVTVLNPLASSLFVRYERLEPRLEGAEDTPFSISSGGFWLREVHPDGFLVTHARGARQIKGVLSLEDVTVFRFDVSGRFTYRTDARTATLGRDSLLLSDAIETRPGDPPLRMGSVTLPTNLTLPKIQDSFSSPGTISFWGLPSFIHFFEAAGFSASAHRLHFQSLLASPVMVISMVLMGAVFSITAGQRGANWLARFALATASGFGIYFLGRVTYALGQSETLPSFLAAWAPPLITLFLALFLLFHLEDG